MIYLEQTILIFLTTFALKGYFRSKIEKKSISIEFSIFEFLNTSCFFLNRQFWFFWTNLLKKGIFSVQNRKIKHHYRIKHIWFSLDAKFHVKQIILMFLDKYAKKCRTNIAYRKQPSYSKIFHLPWNSLANKSVV